MSNYWERIWITYGYKMGLRRMELGEISEDEAYAFAGRMRKYLPERAHELVGYLAMSIRHRSYRGGVGLDEVERCLREYAEQEGWTDGD